MKKITYILVLLLISCSSKKKITERERIKEDRKEVIKVNQIIKTDIVTDSLFTSKSETIEISETDEIILTQADDKDHTIHFKDNTGRNYTVKGANLTIRNNKSLESKKDTLSSAVKDKRQYKDHERYSNHQRRKY